MPKRLFVIVIVIVLIGLSVSLDYTRVPLAAVKLVPGLLSHQSAPVLPASNPVESPQLASSPPAAVTTAPQYISETPIPETPLSAELVPAASLPSLDVPTAMVELPVPPPGEDWPFFIAIFNDGINPRSRTARPLVSLTALEKTQITKAVEIFTVNLSEWDKVAPDTENSPESPSRYVHYWTSAKMLAEEHLRRTLGHSAYNSLSRISSQP